AWQPGETVSLVFHELADPPNHADVTKTSVANTDGFFANSQYVLEDHDAGVTYVVTATGQSSGIQAQTTFTDAPPGPCYRTVASGNWNSTATWESAPSPACSAWAAASATPTNADNTITIRNGDIVHVTADVTTDETVVDSGGDLEIDSGVTLSL